MPLNCFLVIFSRKYCSSMVDIASLFWTLLLEYWSCLSWSNVMICVDLIMKTHYIMKTLTVQLWINNCVFPIVVLCVISVKNSNCSRVIKHWANGVWVFNDVAWVWHFYCKKKMHTEYQKGDIFLSPWHWKCDSYVAAASHGFSDAYSREKHYVPRTFQRHRHKV